MLIKLNYIKYFLLFYGFFIQHNFAQNNIPPTITASGNQSYCPLSEINIVNDFNIVDPDDLGIDAFYIQISTGYVLGQDSLMLIGSHPNIIESWNISEGKLSLIGIGNTPILYTDLIAAVKDVVFSSASVTVSGDKYFSFNIGDANYLPKTDHYYEYVSDLGITWSDAKTAAANRTYFGLQGYLATILYPEEAQLAGEQAAGAGWIGGSDAETEGIWKWATGPETGTVFWNGLWNGSTPNYANWNTGEPNNCCGGENYAHVTYNGGRKGSWNDLSNTGAVSGDYQPKGYIVEYGGMPGDPILNISASTQIHVNALENHTNVTRCGNGSVTLQATSFYGTVLWYDAITGGNQVGSGFSFVTPNLTTTMIYYALASENGCIEGVRTPVLATVYDLPVIQSNIVFKNCDEDGTPDGFINYNLKEANDIISYNNSSGLIFSYYMSFNDADIGNNEILNSTSYNNSNGNTVYARVENTNGCHQICEVNLEVSTTSFPQGYLQELENCDDDSIIDGFYEFDLAEASSSFLSQFPPGQNLSVHYFRTLNDALLENNEILNQSSFVNEPPFSQILYVRVESDDNGDCFGLGPHLLLTVHPRPEFEVGQSGIFCNDNVPVTLYVFNYTGDFTYEWKDESGQVISSLPDASIVSGGIYTTVATSTYSCESFSISYNVAESIIANITLDDISIVELTDNNSIAINNDNNNLGIGDYEFALDNKNGPYQDEPYFNGVGAGSHILFVKDKNLCGIAELDVFILGFPKFFTPNNDGNNDTWNIIGLSDKFAQNSTVYIYDRYGKLIKQLNPRAQGWNGLFNGQMLSSSDYWFVVELVELTGNIQTFRGHFSLVR